MNVRFLADAAEEIEHERAWYRQRSERAERSFLHELDHAVDSICEAPGRWPVFIAGARRYVFPTFPFSIIYIVEGELVLVVALAHQNRRVGYWRERIP